MFYASPAFSLLSTTSVSEVYLAVPPKDDPEADDRDIKLKPSARSGSSPPHSAPGGYSSMFCGSSAISLCATTSASEVSPPVSLKDGQAAPSARFRSKKKRDPAADDKDINLKPSTRSASKPVPPKD
jgi:hypothetical protein